MTERVYNGYPVAAQQKCLALSRRHFKKVVSLSHGNNSVLGQAFLDLIDEAFRQHRYWRETRSCAHLLYLGFWVQVTHNPEHRAMERPEPDTRRVSYCDLPKADIWLKPDRYGTKPPLWWYFLDHPEVPPDNNLAERSLRKARDQA